MIYDHLWVMILAKTLCQKKVKSLEAARTIWIRVIFSFVTVSRI